MQEGIQAVDEAFSRVESGPEDDVNAPAIVRNLLIRTQDEHEWRRLIPMWIGVFADHDALARLGQALLETIRTLRIPWLTDSTPYAWAATWKDLSAGVRDLELPVRYLEVAAAYRSNPDRRILLSLPREERQIVEPLLGPSLQEIDGDVK